MTDQVDSPVGDNVRPDDPTQGFSGDPTRARRCEFYTLAALVVGGTALVSLAAGAATAGTDSPVAGYLTWIILGALALLAAAAGLWITSIRMGNSPHVQLAWAIADRDALATATADMDRQIADARKRLDAARQNGTLPASPAGIGATYAQAWVTERDGEPATDATPDGATKRRPSPRRRRARVAA